MTTDTILEDPRWREIGLENLADQATTATFRHLGVDPDDWEVTVLGCDNARIAALNGEFREMNKATNVLSWPSEDRSAAPGKPTGDPELGDIALAFETCRDEAEAGGTPLASHTLHLIVHGVLHLLGYDHIRDEDADLMETTEIAILETLGVPNPYAG